MKIYNVKYHEVIRIEIKDIKTGEVKAVQFIQTTMEEVINYFNSKCQPYLRIDEGIKVKVNIKESDPIKRWKGPGQKNYTIKIASIESVLSALAEGVEESD